MQLDELNLDRTPLTARPWHVLGHRKDGRPIHPIAGADDGEGGQGGQGGEAGSGNGQAGGQADGQTSGSTGSQGNESGQPGASGNGQSGGQQAAGSGNGAAAEQRVEDLPEWAQKVIRDARKEAGDNRTAKNAAEAKQTQTLDAIAKALGLKKDETPDPAKLAEQLTAAQTAQRQAQVELAVHRGAGKHQADPSALLDSRTFLAKVAELDPTAKDFADKVDTAIKDAVTSNPKLKAGQAPGRSSVDHSGGTGERRNNQPLALADAVTAHYGQ